MSPSAASSSWPIRRHAFELGSAATLPAMTRNRAVLALVAAAATFAGCASESPRRGSSPLTDLRNPALSASTRVEAVDALWGQTRPGTPDRAAARKTMKDLAWSQATPLDLRLKIMRTLLDDTDAEGAADAREMARLMLPSENSRTMVALLSDTAARRGWEEFIPPLVRSFKRPVPEVRDEERAERTALVALRPNQPVESTVFDVFLNPPKMEQIYGVDFQTRLRADAWDLLGRLDADGRIRTGLLGALTNPQSNEPNDRVLADLRACINDLRCLPITGDELKWLQSLRNEKDAANRQWWTQARNAIAELHETGSSRIGELALRHAEPIRWAAVHKPEYLGKTREELRAELAQRFSRRSHNTRSTDQPKIGRPYTEMLSQWDDALCWADILTMLVIDDAARSPEVVAAFFQQAELDRKDETTEYGGVLRTIDLTGSGFIAMLYPPRPSQRLGDRQFVASDDMIAGSDRALAHYHFHAQSVRNRTYAGPSWSDLEYARRLGRSCIVVTSIGSNTMGIDYYQPNGAIIDMGEITRPNP